LSQEEEVTNRTREETHGALDFARMGFDSITTLAEAATLEITDLSYSALRSAGAWPVVVEPIHSVQRGATILIFRCVSLGAHAVLGVASVGARLVT
jgi:hypothetical protein